MINITEKKLTELMDVGAVDWLTEPPVLEGRLLLQALRDEEIYDYIDALDYFLDRIEEVDLEGTIGYFYFDRGIVTDSFILASYDKNLLIDHCLVDFFVKKYGSDSTI